MRAGWSVALFALTFASLGPAARATAAEERDDVSANHFGACQSLSDLSYPVTSQRDVELFGECVGMIKALAMVSPALEANARFCMPPGVTWAQMGAVAYRYIEQAPQLRHLPYYYLAIQAWRQAWPCP